MSYLDIQESVLQKVSEIPSDKISVYSWDYHGVLDSTERYPIVLFKLNVSNSNKITYVDSQKSYRTDGFVSFSIFTLTGFDLPQTPVLEGKLQNAAEIAEELDKHFNLSGNLTKGTLTFGVSYITSLGPDGEKPNLTRTEYYIPFTYYRTRS